MGGCALRSRHVPRFRASSSQLGASVCPELQPQTPPGPPRRTLAQQPPSARVSVKRWLPKCPLGATGPGPRTCLVFPSRPGTSAAVSPRGARIPGQAQSGRGGTRGHRAPCTLGPCSTGTGIAPTHVSPPRVRCPLAAYPAVPQASSVAPEPCQPLPALLLLDASSKPHHWVGLGGRPGPAPGTPHVPRARHGHTHAHAGAHVPPAVPTEQPQSPGRGSPARPALLGQALLLNVSQPTPGHQPTMASSRHPSLGGRSAGTSPSVTGPDKLARARSGAQMTGPAGPTDALLGPRTASPLARRSSGDRAGPARGRHMGAKHPGWVLWAPEAWAAAGSERGPERELPAPPCTPGQPR